MSVLRESLRNLFQIYKKTRFAAGKRVKRFLNPPGVPHFNGVREIKPPKNE